MRENHVITKLSTTFKIPVLPALTIQQNPHHCQAPSFLGPSILEQKPQLRFIFGPAKSHTLMHHTRTGYGISNPKNTY
jgi:hypothetical protein